MSRTLVGRMAVLVFAALLGSDAAPAYAGTDMTVAAAINKAGSQRMLSQRQAKFYLLQAWEVNTAAARMEMNYARAEFASGMHQLYTAWAGVRTSRRRLNNSTANG